MKEIKNKSYVLYIKGVEAFEKYKIPNVELMETKKFTDKQLANIAKGDMFLLSRQYNQKLWKMLKKIYAKQFKIVSIWIDSSIANLSFELFDKKQNLHTFKFHTEDSVLDFKVFKTKKEIGRGSGTPFFFASFTGPGSYSGRGIMSSAQFDNMFTATSELVNKHAEANGECSELLNPKVGKEDDADNEEVIIIYRHDGLDPAGKKAARICSYRKCKKEDITTILRRYHEGDVFNIIEKNSEQHNLLLKKLESPSMELTSPLSSKNFIIYIQDELLYNIGSMSEKDRLSCKYMMHANAVDLVYLYFPIPEQFISGKIKVLTQQQDARQIHMPIKIDKGECTFKFNVGGFTEKDCSLSELVDKLDEVEVKQGDSISAEIKFAHNQLEMNLINKIAEII